MLDEKVHHLVGHRSFANKSIFFDIKHRDDKVIVTVVEIFLNSFGGARRPLRIRTASIFNTYTEAIEYLKKCHGVR